MVLIALVSSADARDPCKKLTVEDPYTGKTTFTARISDPFFLPHHEIIIEAADGTARLLFTVSEEGEFDGRLQAGIQVPFLFKGQEVMELTNQSEGLLSSYVREEKIWTKMPFIFLLEREQVDMMAKLALVSARMPVASGTTDVPLYPVHQARLLKTAACLQTFLDSTQPAE